MAGKLTEAECSDCPPPAYPTDATRCEACPHSAAKELRAHWGAFCDADYFEGIDTFPERMEAVGLIELVAVDDDALEDAFAYERGIIPGGSMWQLTPAGRAALEREKRG